jgi:hypothetical protein
VNRVPNDDVTPLAFGMVRIVVDLCERVLKYRCGIFEGDVVLKEIGGSLRSVPFKCGSTHRGDATAMRRAGGSVR